MNKNEGATDNGREARPSSLGENGGDGSSKIIRSEVKVGEGRN
jgi:hypothetical protein